MSANLRDRPTVDGVYSSSGVCRVVPGLTYRQLDHWTRKGYLTPSLAPGDGSGNRRRWSHQDVQTARRLMSVARLREMFQDGTIWQAVLDGNVTIVVRHETPERRTA
jgi:hypothetical protein